MDGKSSGWMLLLVSRSLDPLRVRCGFVYRVWGLELNICGICWRLSNLSIPTMLSLVSVKSLIFGILGGWEVSGNKGLHSWL